MAPRFKDGDAVVSVSAHITRLLPRPLTIVSNTDQWQMDWMGSYRRGLCSLLQCLDRRRGIALPQDCSERALRLSR